MEDSVRFELLGPLRAYRGLQELELGPARQQAVLATLLLAANHAVPASEIVDQVWGDEPPANGANVVQKYVAGLRRVLEPDRLPRAAGQLLTSTPAGYRLSVPPGGSDLDVFTAHVDEARRLRALGCRAEATAELRTGLLLWRSEPLAGLTGGYFDATRAQLAGDRAAALEEWAELELEQGREQALLPELSRLIAEYPRRQRLRAVHVLALYRTGRQADALTSYQQALQLVGGRPSPELQAAHRQVLQSDRPPPVPSVEAEPMLTHYWPEPVRGPLGWKGWTLKVAAALLPSVTLSIAAAPLIGGLAIRRRSWKLGLAALGYLVSSIAFFTIANKRVDSEDFVLIDGVAMTGLLLSTVVAGIQAAWLIAPRTRAAAPRVMVDLNSAPEQVLRTLPGIEPMHAVLIIAERNARGPFRSLEDAVARGMFPSPVPRQIADVVLVIPVQDAPKEERR
ncbi:BTAD domain-containing putative transcriptional regulator [Kribbella sp. NPDC051587]|uniref:BTAD domain-containing putative transcriptional regulator n=1 Tax=Kribbella sp. NPDC051587 TaxID=3364119 RepID=UPI0037AC2D9A